MKNIAYIKWLTILVCITGMTSMQSSEKASIDSLMRQLDDVIAHRSVYLKQKENTLRQLNQELEAARTDRQRFEVLTHLYDEYHSFNTDSAYNISFRQEMTANRIGDAVLRAHALMNRAAILSATGMYNETLELIDSIHIERLPAYLHPYYYHIKRTVYGRLADFAVFGREENKYARLTEMYRDSIMAVNDPSSLAYAITDADRLNVNGNPGAALRVLARFMTSRRLSQHEKAICAWTMAESYGLLGDKVRQKQQLLISSIYDIKSSVREYMSLRRLALVLYEEGDLDRAHKLMDIAVDDATKCNARQRIVELNYSYPEINDIYVRTVRDQKKALIRTMLIITVLSLVLLTLLIYMRRQMQRISHARKEVEEAYIILNEVTEQLKKSNENLCQANNDIAELSELKEVYIGRYMDQCLGYIDKLDSYRKSMGKLLNSNKMAELRKLVNSTSIIDNDLKWFYEQFDTTFLSLFPTFVDDFNKLLIPEVRIKPKKEGTLNAELRIFALIRLGISDSDRIARFLRYSLTTIYNYRTRVRNKALIERNRLEEEVMKIGRSR